MIMPDVNVIIGAMRQDDEQHAMLRTWLARAVGGPEPLGLSVLVLGGVVRVMSNARFYGMPTHTSAILSELDRLIERRKVVVVSPTAQHWAVLSRLCRATGIQGSGISDVQHAALAIEHDATWVSLDRGFARFPGLRWELPTAPVD